MFRVQSALLVLVACLLALVSGGPLNTPLHTRLVPDRVLIESMVTRTEPSTCTCCKVNFDLRPDNTINVKNAKGGTQTSLAEAWNLYGGRIQEYADELGADVSTLLGCLMVESGGKSFVNDRAVIRFECHIMRRKLNEKYGPNSQQMSKFAETFECSTKENKDGRTIYVHQIKDAAGNRDIHGSQDREWEALQLAQDIDDGFAIEAISIGAPQVMGFNYRDLGADSPQTYLTEMTSGIAPQLLAFKNYIKNRGSCKSAVKSGSENFPKFVACYNGAKEGSADNKWYSDLMQTYKAAATAVLAHAAAGEVTPCSTDEGEGTCVEGCICSEQGGTTHRGKCPGSLLCCTGNDANKKVGGSSSAPEVPWAVVEGTCSSWLAANPLIDCMLESGKGTMRCTETWVEDLPNCFSSCCAQAPLKPAEEEELPQEQESQQQASPCTYSSKGSDFSGFCLKECFDASISVANKARGCEQLGSGVQCCVTQSCTAPSGKAGRCANSCGGTTYTFAQGAKGCERFPNGITCCVD